MTKKIKYQEHVIANNDLPDYVRKKLHKCFVCGEMHLVTGGISLSRLTRINYKKTQYIVVEHAPLGCWLIHNKGFINRFFKAKDSYGWKRTRKKIKKNGKSPKN